MKMRLGTRLSLLVLIVCTVQISAQAAETSPAPALPGVAPKKSPKATRSTLRKVKKHFKRYWLRYLALTAVIATTVASRPANASSYPAYLEISPFERLCLTLCSYLQKLYYLRPRKQVRSLVKRIADIPWRTNAQQLSAATKDQINTGIKKSGLALCSTMGIPLSVPHEKAYRLPPGSLISLGRYTLDGPFYRIDGQITARTIGDATETLQQLSEVTRSFLGSWTRTGDQLYLNHEGTNYFKDLDGRIDSAANLYLRQYQRIQAASKESPPMPSTLTAAQQVSESGSSNGT